MRKLQMKMNMSLDGFVASKDGKMDWLFKTSVPESKAWSVAQSKDAGLIIIGRKSFEAMARYWPTSTDPFATPMNEIPKAVFTKNGFSGVDFGPEPPPAAASWANARIFNGDLAEGIRELKAGEGKPILAIGGAGFMRSLIATGLIDEYYLAIHPVVLGSGVSIFSGLETERYLKPVEVKTFPGGAAVHIFENK